MKLSEKITNFTNKMYSDNIKISKSQLLEWIEDAEYLELDPIQQKEILSVELQICRLYGTTPSEIKRKLKVSHVCHARQVCMFYRWLNGMTLDESGKPYRKDHATVLYGIKSILNAYNLNDYSSKKYWKVIKEAGSYDKDKFMSIYDFMVNKYEYKGGDSYEVLKHKRDVNL